MDKPVASHEEIFTTLGKFFYSVVPTQYNTYWSLTAMISQRALRHFDIDARVVPCLADGWMSDAATHHFRRQIGLDTRIEWPRLPILNENNCNEKALRRGGLVVWRARGDSNL